MDRAKPRVWPRGRNTAAPLPRADDNDGRKPRALPNLGAPGRPGGSGGAEVNRQHPLLRGALQGRPAKGRGRVRGSGRVDGAGVVPASATLGPAAVAARSSGQPGSLRGQKRGAPQRACDDVRRGLRPNGRSNPRQNSGRSNALHGVRHPAPTKIGLKKLEELAMDNGMTIMEKLSKDSTLLLFEKLTCEEKMEKGWIRLMVTILSKVCQVEYKPIVVRLFGKICQKQFIDQLVLHITHLPYDKNSNRSEAARDFLNELCTLCSAIIELTPNLACESLDIILKRACQDLEDMHPFEGCDAIRKKLAYLREKLKYERERLESIGPAPSPAVPSGPSKPPNDFHELSHFPAKEDIVAETYVRPFLRPNKVDPKIQGSYENVNEYLDVHFRLMREDFLRPLREGILDFRKALEERNKTNDKKAPRVQNIRIYENVQILHVDTEDERVGLVLNFDPQRKFASDRIQWEYSKRLMTGSLIVLSQDEQFSSIVMATVAKRDPKELYKGRVLVELCEGAVSKDVLRRQFLMVECQVFFGAYSHVLKALKDFDENSFPLSDYIVYASNTRELPAYQQRALEAKESLKLSIKSDDASRRWKSVSVDVDNLKTWPSASELGLDESQYEAMCGALTNKLMLIQGPPGTGKTFIGLKIAACLIKNEKLWRTEEDRRPMLVVCYTNHALDQFLTGLLPVTQSIVRVGGGCKDPKLDIYSLKNRRRNSDYSCPPGLRLNILQERKKFQTLKSLGDRIRHCSSLLKEGLVSMQTLWSYGIVTEQYRYLTAEDIFKWLCGLNELPEILRRRLKPLVFLNSADHAFPLLEFPTAGVEAVTMVSCSYGLLENKDDLLEFQSADQYQFYLHLVEDLKRKLASTVYPRRTEPPQHIHPAGIWRLRNNERWQLYRYWRDTLISILEEDYEPLLDEIDVKLTDVAKLLATWKMVEDQHVMAEHTVIGMTTSFAASHQQNLKELKPRIVIVEEAAEVFESHVLVSLAGDVEHLIMIGDHQQLRPSPSVHELGVRYHLNVSLFERLIRNGVNYVTLSTQHRMRPALARLICPAIYPELKNHPSVTRFPAVLGVAKKVFFVDHKNPEQVVQDSQSYQNRHEAEFLLSLVKYLLLQGYNPEKITVLSTYKGQDYFFSKLKKSEPDLEKVRITVVDNFQGEESDIILLSLVRSNTDKVVGFLKTENRVCVALSRARHGLFIVGNMSNMTSADTVWRKVEEELHRQNAIGPALPLRCERHGVVTRVTKAEDFSSCPQGGCLEVCSIPMPCGHACKEVCHIQDMEHKKAKCMEKCERPACPLQHSCPQRCFVKPCPPCLVPKEEVLPCGHTARMACHVDPLQYRCKAVGSCTLPACGHERDAFCYQRARLHELPCKIPCDSPMPCGHTCPSTCHVAKDPEHKEVKCRQPCGQKRRGCSADPAHQCRLGCNQRCEDCTELVDRTLACGHINKLECNDDAAAKLKCRHRCKRTLPCGHKCSKECSEPCEEKCTVQVSKSLPRCGHTQTMSCSQSPDAVKGCKEPCQRTLPCGHECGLLCDQDCSSFRCREVVPFPGTPACGHTISVPCYLQKDYAPSSAALLALCTHPCPVLLQPCGHKCAGSCGACLQGRLHQPCKSKCERILLCGHLCENACAVSCPPCTRTCEQKCVHGSCAHRCGEPCTRCTEPCRQKCEHGQCYKRCGDRCSFECSEPCQKKVEGCRHDCIGLCGDPCICLECNEEEVTTQQEADEGARFVILPDCKHILESRTLDRWMSTDDPEDKRKEIKPRVCPKCTTPVTSCHRYRHVTKRVAKDIMDVKAQFFDTKKIQSHLDKIKELLRGVPQFPKECRAAGRVLSQVFRLLVILENRMPKGRESGSSRQLPPLDTNEAKNLEQKVVLLRSLALIVFRDQISSSGRTEVQQAVELLCGNLSQRDLVRLSEQEADDLSLELHRLQRLVQLLLVENGSSFLQLKASDKANHEEVSRILRGPSALSQEQDRQIQEKLDALAAASSVANIALLELAPIVAASEAGTGRWFRCPNGHPCCIADDGGAVEEEMCLEEGCGLRIGRAG